MAFTSDIKIAVVFIPLLTFQNQLYVVENMNKLRRISTRNGVDRLQIENIEIVLCT